MTNSLETKNKAQPVVIFDSGAGGLPYLELATKHLPDEYFYYVADTAGFPYGDKETPLIQEIILKLVDRIILRLNPKCIVVACNTATVIALSLLRQKYQVPFIGVVPAVKPAAEGSQKKKFGVLATQQTAKNSYLADLIASFAPACDVLVLPAGNLRDIVEHSYFTVSAEEKIREIQTITSGIPLDEVDSLVLGCTHFIHLEEEFKVVLGNQVKLIDSREGVIRQLERVLKQKHLAANSKAGSDTLFLTKADVARQSQYLLFAQKYGLHYGGEL